MESHQWWHQFSLARETASALGDFVLMQNHVNWFFTCVVAESLPLFSPPVKPGTEAHEDNPAGPSQTSDEGRLLYHVWDAVVALRSCHYVPQFCTWGHRTHKATPTAKWAAECQYISMNRWLRFNSCARKSFWIKLKYSQDMSQMWSKKYTKMNKYLTQWEWKTS